MATRPVHQNILLQCETITTCTARCHFCPYKDNLDKAGNVMSKELFEKVADQMAEIPEMGTLQLQGIGEPFLDPLLTERLRYCQKLDIWASIYSNGHVLTPELFDHYVECGLSALTISLNANTQEQHEKIMGVKGKFKHVVDVLDYIIANKPKEFDLSIHTVRNKDYFDEYDAGVFVSRWGLINKGTGYGRVIAEGNWAGLNRTVDLGHYLIGTNKCCQRALMQYYILWDGKVVTCCFDPYGENVWGDANTQTLKEIYANPDWVQLREDHWNNQAMKHKICQNCTRI